MEHRSSVSRTGPWPFPAKDLSTSAAASTQQTARKPITAKAFEVNARCELLVTPKIARMESVAKTRPRLVASIATSATNSGVSRRRPSLRTRKLWDP
jgi:hypothetical protein